MIDPHTLGLSDPTDLTAVLAHVQAEWPAGKVPILQLRGRDYHVTDRTPIHRPVIVRGEHRLTTRIVHHGRSDLVVGYTPEAPAPDGRGRWRNRDDRGRRRWLVAVQGPWTAGRTHSGWRGVHRLTVRLGLEFPGGRMPVGTFLCSGDSWWTPHLVVTHWGGGWIRVRTTTVNGGLHDDCNLHEFQFRTTADRDAIDLRLTIDPEAGIVRAAVDAEGVPVEDSGSRVNVLPTVPLRPRTRLRGAFLDPMVIGAVIADGANRDSPGDLWLPGHGDDFTFTLAGLSAEVDGVPLAESYAGGYLTRCLAGSGESDFQGHFDIGPENQLASNEGGTGVQGVTIEDIDIWAGGNWHSPLKLARCLDFRLARCRVQGGASCVASVPWGATYRHAMEDVETLGGWDCPIQLSDASTMTLTRVMFGSPGRHCVRASAGNLRLVDCGLYAPRHHHEHVVANWCGGHGWTTSVERFWNDDEHDRIDPATGLPYLRSLVYHESSLYGSNVARLVDSAAAASRCRFGLVEVSAPPWIEHAELRPGVATAERCISMPGVPIFATAGVLRKPSLATVKGRPLWSLRADESTTLLNPDSPIMVHPEPPRTFPEPKPEPEPVPLPDVPGLPDEDNAPESP